MTLKEVQEIIRHLVEYDIEEFEYEKAGTHLRIRRNRLRSTEPAEAKAVMAIEANLSPAAPVPAAALPVPTAAAAPVDARSEERPVDYHIIRSPIVGTFYKAPNPDAPPFVKVGSKVEEGQVLCIVEAMKLMNEIESDIAGEIAEVYAENKQPVEYGQPLFAIRQSSRMVR